MHILNWQQKCPSVPKNVCREHLLVTNLKWTEWTHNGCLNNNSVHCSRLKRTTCWFVLGGNPTLHAGFQQGSSYSALTVQNTPYYSEFYSYATYYKTLKCYILNSILTLSYQQYILKHKLNFYLYVTMLCLSSAGTHTGKQCYTTQIWLKWHSCWCTIYIYIYIYIHYSNTKHTWRGALGLNILRLIKRTVKICKHRKTLLLNPVSSARWNGHAEIFQSILYGLLKYSTLVLKHLTPYIFSKHACSRTLTSVNTKNKQQ
jgi:hypothetical protein